jgi:hypothetical protein
MKAMEILEYLRQPIFIENRNLTKIKDKVKGVIITYFIYLLPVFCSVLLLFILDKFIIGHFYDYSILEKLYSNQQELKSIKKSSKKRNKKVLEWVVKTKQKHPDQTN